MAFSRGHNKRVDFVIPISSNCEKDPTSNWPQYSKDINGLGRSYLVGVLFEDFVDLTRDMTLQELAEQKKMLKMAKKTGRRASKLIGESHFAGFRFMKAVLIRTRFPMHEFVLEMLNAFIDLLKLERSRIISEEIGKGVQLEDIDMTEVDSQFTDNFIIEAYQKMLETVPKSDVINTGDTIKVETDFDMKVEYKVPP